MKKNKIKAGTISQSIFKTFFLSLAIIANVHFAWAQQSIVPNGYQTYLDQNGKPLSSGKVFYYTGATGSTVPKTTYQDIGGTTPNTNPVTLNAAGRALVWGTGNYRQIVQDKNNNIIWDTITSAAGSGSGGGTIATGDGDLVGTIKPWAGMTAPNQYMFTYGQEISRTTYSALFTAIASTQAIFCNSGSPILTGLGDTTNFWIGMSVEVGCVSGGVSTIISKTSSSVTLAANANLTENVNAVFFPWGRGNGTTTFNLPDFRGLIPMGNNIMGGVASSNVSDTNFGATTPESSGGQGGSQSKTIALNNLPSYTPTGTVALRTIGVNASPIAVESGQVAITIDDPGSGTPRSIYVAGSFGVTSASFTGVQQGGGGIASTATIVAAGSGYTNGSQTITVTGGTCSIQPQFTVTISGNVFTGTPALLTSGACTVAPTNPASTTGGGGTGGTLNVVYTSNSFSLIPPTKTVNYIIKVTPDANSATASGVTSLGGMTGDIACGNGLTCTGNVISTLGSSGGSIGINATAYGVKCDGVTDDTSSSQIAINASNGVPVIFPTGTCKITSTLSYIVSSGAQSQGLQIIGQGPYKTTFDNEVANGALFSVDGSSISHFSVGTTFANFGINTVSRPSNSSGILLHQAWSVLVKNVIIQNLSGNGITGTTSAGDADAASVTVLDQVRMNNNAGWCVSFNAPSGGYYGSNTRIQNFLFSSCGAATNVVPPTSGGIEFKGLELQLLNGGLTTNNGPDLYVQQNDTSINITIDGVDFENNSSTVLPHIYSDTGLRGLKITNSECLSSDSFISQGCLWSSINGGLFDAKIDNIRVRATAANNTYTAFKLAGSNDDPTSVRVGNIYWIDFDHSGQSRFSGIQFDPIPGSALFSISTLNTAQLIPSGNGNVVPIRQATTGEWISCAIASAGITKGSIGGLTPSTLYYFYAYNSASAVSPTTCAIDNPSTTAPTIDIVGGYNIKTGDPTRTYIGAWPTDGSGNFQTTGAGFSWYPFGQSIPFGATGTIYQGQGPTSPPVWTRNPTLGTAGSAVGSLCFANLTSGSICVQPDTGALATAIVTMKAGTYNVVGDSLAQTLTNKTLGSTNLTGVIIATGTPPVGTTGSCVASSFVGGATAGKFSAAVCAGGTIILSSLPTAPNGYTCNAQDQTTPADTLKQTANTITSVTFTATTVASDVIVFKCMGW